MNPYRARMAGLLVPLAALAGCSSSSSSSTKSMTSTTSKTSSSVTTKVQPTPDAQATREATKKQLVQDLAQGSKGITVAGSNNFHLLWSHAGTGVAKYPVNRSTSLMGWECSGGGTITVIWSGDKKPQQWSCSIPGHMMTLVDSSRSHRSLEVKPSSPQTVWALATWSGPHHR